MTNSLKIGSVITFVVLGFLSIIPDSFAETEKLTVSPGNAESLRFYLEDGDRIKFWIAVSGGANDDVNISIKNPNGGIENQGLLKESFNDELLATTTGTYYFEFDNTFSLVSTKYVTFDYQIIKKPIPIPSATSYGGGGGGGEWLLLIIIGAAIGIPIVIWKKKKGKTREDKPEEFTKLEEDIKSEEKEQISSQNEKALKILKERLAKGEISKKEYDELKKEFKEDV